MRLLYDNKIQAAVLIPSSENANYPASNLKDPRLSRHLRFTGDAAEDLVIDAGGALKEIFRATTNLIADPEDLTTASWTPSGATVALSGLYYDNKQFSKVTNSGAAPGFVGQSETAAFTTLTPSGSVICRKGSSAGNTTIFTIRNLTTAANVFYLVIDFDNYPNSPGTPTIGTLHHYEWIDAQTIQIFFICAALAALTDDLSSRCFGSNNATAGEYTHWTAVQLEDNPWPTPYVNGSRSAVNPDYPFQMPEKFIFKVKCEPWFIYSTGQNKQFFGWYIDPTHRLRCHYYQADHRVLVTWQDGGIQRSLASQPFDDGTNYDDINSNLILFGAIDLTTQTGNNRFFVIVAGAKQSEATDWGGVPDNFESTLPTFSLGHENSSLHADSQFESVQFWAWDGSDLGTLNSETDIDVALKDKPAIFEQVYQPQIKASYAALAGHNLSAGALVKVQGNDFDSWNGPPFEQELTWAADIILKNFTEKEYPYWRFVFADPNNQNGYIKLGLAYLGTYYQVLQGFEKDFTAERVNTDVTHFSDSGQSYSRKGIDYRRYPLDFTWWEDEVKREIEAIMETVGKRNPFFVVLDENNLTALPPLYCKIEKEPEYQNLIGYIWKSPLILREVF